MNAYFTVCRPRFPLAVPDWSSATPAHVITDDETISENETYTTVDLADRLAIADMDQKNADAVEFFADSADPNRGTICVYPNPWRAMAVLHTGDEQVSLSYVGEQQREETEVVAFTAGVGSTKYPIASIASKAWQYADLGSVLFAPDSCEITSAIPDYSLLKLT
ncbi:MAG: hypothetical protein HQL87_13055 [Magnetococcales bacterium]|nr:hypothetical protein [Magnetococcales bacterium]